MGGQRDCLRRFVGSALLSRFIGLLVVFGVFLIYTGARVIRHRDDEGEKTSTRGLGLLRRFMTVSDQLDGSRFVTRIDGRRAATHLLAALVVVEFTDVIFAVDSVPAILAVLMFVGLTIVISPWTHLPTSVSLTVICVLLVAAIGVERAPRPSARAHRRSGHGLTRPFSQRDPATQRCVFRADVLPVRGRPWTSIWPSSKRS